MIEKWRQLPPWARTFLRGLLIAITLPIVAVVKDPGFSGHLVTDPLAVLGALGAVVLAAVVHYVMDRLDITIAEAMAGGGLALAILSAGGSYLAITTATHIGVTPPGVETGDTIKVVAREPGSSFPSAQFACDPAVTVGKTVMTDAPQGGTRYVAGRGTETLNWPDSPEGQNPSARHYWHNGPLGTPTHRDIDPSTGAPAEVGQQISEDAEITKPAADCLKARAR